MANKRPLVVSAGAVREIATGDTVPLANGGTGATTAAGARTNLDTVFRGGDTMTGDLEIAKATPVLRLASASGSDPVIRLVKPASGRGNFVVGLTGANARWVMSMGDQSAESGSNAGSDFTIQRYNDAGTFLATAVTVRRSDGHVAVGQSIAAGTTILAGSHLYSGAGTWGIVNGTAVLNPGQAISFSGVVTDPGATYQMVVFGDPGTGAASYHRLYHLHGSWYGHQFVVGGSPTRTFEMRHTGIAYNDGGWTIFSDARLKERVQDAEPVLPKLASYRAVTYYRKDQPVGLNGPEQPRRELGVLAQEVKELWPEVVTVGGSQDMPDKLAVDYARLAAVALQGVKELLQRVETLEARIAALTGERA